MWFDERYQQLRYNQQQFEAAKTTHYTQPNFDELSNKHAQLKKQYLRQKKELEQLGQQLEKQVQNQVEKETQLQIEKHQQEIQEAEHNQAIIDFTNEIEWLKAKNLSLQRENEQEYEDNVCKRVVLQNALDEANYLDDMFGRSDVSIIPKEMITNHSLWQSKKKIDNLTYWKAVQEYEEKKELIKQDGGDLSTFLLTHLCPKEQGTRAAIVFQLTNLDKKFHTDDLKLFFSSRDVGNGRWVQFHGPGKEVDGGRWNHPLSIFSLIDPFKPRQIVSSSDHDRCEFSKSECRKHSVQMGNYELYHVSKTFQYKSNYTISIKWE